MARAKSTLAVTEPANREKPIVKKFIDRNLQIVDFIKLRLPHIPHTSLRIVQVYASKDDKTFRYRVNYYKEIRHENSIVVTSDIVKSQYIEIRVILRNSGYEMEDRTELYPNSLKSTQ